jgi:hypothetical protein
MLRASRARRVCVPTPQGMDAALPLDDRAVDALLQLGRDAYPHQRQALEAQKGGRDVLLCAATGSGKSAAYQAAAYAEPDTLTVVVAPLVELIYEQTERTSADLRALAALGWPAGGRRVRACSRAVCGSGGAAGGGAGGGAGAAARGAYGGECSAQAAARGRARLLHSGRGHGE